MAKKPTKGKDSLFCEDIKGASEVTTNDNEESIFKDYTDLGEGFSKDVTVKTKEVVGLQIPSNLEVPVIEQPKTLDYTNEFKNLGEEILVLSKQIINPKDDADNDNAKSYGKKLVTISANAEKARKEYNNPYQEKIDANNDKVKADITEPFKKEVERLKLAITLYDSEKERKRLIEVARVAKEKADKEAEELAEKQRVANVRQKLSEISTNGVNALEKCDTLEELDSFKLKVKSIVLKEEFYKEYFQEATDKIVELIVLIDQRRPLLEEIDKAKKATELLEGEQKRDAELLMKANQEKLDAQKLVDDEKRKNEELEKENKEMTAKQELFTLFSSLGIKKVADKVNETIEKYGSCIIASEKRDELISDYQNSLVEKAKEEEVASEKVKNIRTDYLFDVMDENLVPREYLCVDEAKIKKAIQLHRTELQKDIKSWGLSGILIYPKSSTILK